MGFVKEFKEFAMKGNLIDMAVGVVIGGAFAKIVSAFIDGIVMPVVAMLAGKTNFNDIVFTLKAGTAAVMDTAGNITTAATDPTVMKIGSFITVTIDFIIVAFVVFMVIKGINRMKKKQAEAAPAPPPGPTKEEVLLTEIRDALRNK